MKKVTYYKFIAFGILREKKSRTAEGQETLMISYNQLSDPLFDGSSSSSLVSDLPDESSQDPMILVKVKFK